MQHQAAERRFDAHPTPPTTKPKTRPKRRAPATGAAASNLDLYQVNCTYFDAVGHSINRHHDSRDEVERALDQPVVREMVALIRARNTHPALGGRFTLEAGSDDGKLAMRWTNGEHSARLHVDFTALAHTVEFSGRAPARGTGRRGGTIGPSPFDRKAQQ